MTLLSGLFARQHGKREDFGITLGWQALRLSTSPVMFYYGTRRFLEMFAKIGQSWRLAYSFDYGVPFALLIKP